MQSTQNVGGDMEGTSDEISGGQDDLTSEMNDIQALFREAWRPLVQMATVILQDAHDAEDVVQDVFISVQRNWNRIVRDGSLAAYLRVAVLNRARSIYRRRALLRRSVPPQAAFTPGADMPMLLKEEYAEVVAAIRKLGRRQQQVIALRYWTEMDDGKIAMALGVSESTVRSTASRALQRIEKSIGGDAWQ